MVLSDLKTNIGLTSFIFLNSTISRAEGGRDRCRIDSVELLYIVNCLIWLFQK